MSPYQDLQRRLSQGWNTWNTRSVLSHVLLPPGLAINLGLKDPSTGRFLREALVGRKGQDDEMIVPGPRTYDGAYTELKVSWHGQDLVVQTVVEDGEQLILVTPLNRPQPARLLTVEIGMLWNRPGVVSNTGNGLRAMFQDREIDIWHTADALDDPFVPAVTPYLVLDLQQGPVALGTGARRSVDRVQTLVQRNRERALDRGSAFEPLHEVYRAIQTCLAWDTIYDPQNERVICPVSRIWNCNEWGGWVLFGWDSYFAALLASLDNKELAYINAREITFSTTPGGFVPNYACPRGSSNDRSQPPVGSMVVRELFRTYREVWFVEEVFERLLTWNRWWPEQRNNDGLLSWGSFPDPASWRWCHNHGAACDESGLDNSPMYDGVPFDTKRNILELQDVGLTALYIMDCEALADLAGVLGRKEVRAELLGRAQTFSARMATLWDEQHGLFLNRRTDTGERIRRISPTSFYPLLTRQAVSPEQARRMVQEHLCNPAEFWGEWVIPSISRDDPAYPDQHYWRGRIWAPMNFLAYLGLRRHGLSHTAGELAAKSRDLLLKEWRALGHVHENYCGDTGRGCGAEHSDAFYHWGGLLGLIALMHEGYLAGPENPL